MKKNSVFFNVAVSFLAFYSLYTIAFFSYQVSSGYSAEMRRLELAKNNQLKLARLLLQSDEVEDLEERLALAMDENQIHFYAIKKDGVDVGYGNVAGTDDPTVFIASGGPEATYGGEKDSYRYSVIKEAGYELSVGYKKDSWNYFQAFWRNSKDVVLKDLGIVLLGVIFVVLYSFRDLRKIVSRMKKRGAKRGDIALAKSQETLTLVRGMGGFESKTDSLEKERDIFRTQVLGALRKELESGKKPPYEFDCTLVRTDINNFTQIFTSADRPHFMNTINELFIGVTHTVSRYGGSVYEFIGDEVLFYFKDEDHANSSAVAIAALRDINKLCLEISERTEAEAGYSLRIKSSIAHGHLRFGPLVNAYALAGPPLIETVRMLSHVHEKSENTVLFNESMTDAVSDLCRSRRQQVVMLKGLSGERTLATLEAFTPLSLHLRQGDSESLALAAFYRDDQDICQILDFVSSMRGQLDSGELNKLVSLFRNYKVAKSSANIKRAYINCMSKMVVTFNENEKDTFLLASLVSAANHILTQKEWTGDVRSVMFQCLSHSNRRIIANALDIFSEFEADAGEKVFTDLLKDGDNRIIANILVKDAKRDWNRKVARKVKTMLQGTSPYSKASGLYALGEIAKFVRAADEVAFAADSEIQSLLDLVPKLCEHANAMVRRQAEGVLSKAGRAEAVAHEQTTSDSHRTSNVTPIRKAN